MTKGYEALEADLRDEARVVADDLADRVRHLHPVSESHTGVD